MGYKMLEKEAPGRGKVTILAETYEKGKPKDVSLGYWRNKMETRQERLNYIKTGERYWYAEEGFGSEKRRNPA